MISKAKVDALASELESRWRYERRDLIRLLYRLENIRYGNFEVVTFGIEPGTRGHCSFFESIIRSVRCPGTDSTVHL